MRRFSVWTRTGLLCLTGMLLCVASARAVEKGYAYNKSEKQFMALYETYLKKFQPLTTASETAWWVASTTGTDEAFQHRTNAEAALIELNSDHGLFAEVDSLRKSGQIKEPVLRREIDVLYHTLLPGQADADLQKQVAALESQVEQTFNTYRGLVDGKPNTENDIRAILKDTTNSKEAEKAWKAYMKVGAKVEATLHKVVALRNQIARQLGFANFFSMRLTLQEIDERALFTLFDELDDLTRKPFETLKADIDRRMAKRFGIAVGELRPWHFGDLFFQEAPGVEGVRMDDLLKDRDLVQLARKYYESMGMPIDDIIRRSDLYEREGKSQHAFCTHLDREGDIRVLCNLKPNKYWLETVVHELGHAVYDNYIARDLPFMLREPSHSITTEGIAMMFGSMVKNEAWLQQVLNLSPQDAAKYGAAARRSLRTEKIIFSRWTQVMVRFEYGMYSHPDQNLGKLWWDLKKRYQGLHPPEDVNKPDYAAKVHIVVAPVYYHSYMMGDLFASQVRHWVAVKTLGVKDANKTCFFGRKEAGDFLRKHVFAPGNLYPWNELTKRATGEPLTAKYFAEQYID